MVGSGCPRGGWHSNMAGSPAATTTSVGFWRKSSRSTNIENEGEKNKITRSAIIVSGGIKYIYVELKQKQKQQNTAQLLLGDDFVSYVYYKMPHKISW